MNWLFTKGKVIHYGTHLVALFKEKYFWSHEKLMYGVVSDKEKEFGKENFLRNFGFIVIVLFAVVQGYSSSPMFKF